MFRMRTLVWAWMGLMLVAGEAFAQNARTTPAATASEKKPVSKEEASRALAKALWERVLGAEKLSAGKRRALAEQVHKSVAENTFLKSDDGLIILSLAVLHSFDPGVRHVALPFVQNARAKWPAMVDAKDLPAVWNLFVKNFGSGEAADVATLAGIASAFDGPVMTSSDPARFSYFRGLSRFASKDWAGALSALVRVPLDSSDYRQAKFLEAMALVELKRLDEARDALQMVVALDRTEAEQAEGVDSGEVVRLREKGVVSIARILYEQGRFGESLAYYRSLMQDSHNFYESLSEQGWAFFMAGYPNRAMGAVHAAASPFFANHFNPDIFFLDAVVSYWLCDFDTARTKVQKYIDHAHKEGDVTRNTFQRIQAQSDALLRFARLAEDTAQGVSPKNLGMGRKAQYSLMEHAGVRQALEALKGLIKARAAFSQSKAYANGKVRLEWGMAEFEKSMRLALGAQVRSVMARMAGDFDKTLIQSRILYLELLTAKKDAIVGKGRTVSGGEFVGDEKQFLDLGEKVSRNWSQDKNEYWYDELGHYVFQDRSRCAGSSGQDARK